jgi:hypothetical protein
MKQEMVARPPGEQPPTPTALPYSESELHAAGTIELTRGLVERLGLLARKELELARREAKEDVRRGLVTGGLAGGAGVLFIAALCCGLVAAILALGHVLSPIVVALVGVGLFAVLGIAVTLITVAEGREVRPRRSIRQAQETVHMLRAPVTP